MINSVLGIQVLSSHIQCSTDSNISPDVWNHAIATMMVQILKSI